MKLTIDTKEDKKEDFERILKVLNALMEHKSESVSMVAEKTTDIMMDIQKDIDFIDLTKMKEEKELDGFNLLNLKLKEPAPKSEITGFNQLNVKKPENSTKIELY